MRRQVDLKEERANERNEMRNIKHVQYTPESLSTKMLGCQFLSYFGSQYKLLICTYAHEQAYQSVWTFERYLPSKAKAIYSCSKEPLKTFHSDINNEENFMSKFR
jgi:hypothetical protein